MASWHDRDCRRPDVVLMDDTPTCISCGSLFLQDDDEAQAELGRQATMIDEPSSHLNLDWPSSITFSSPHDVTNPDLRKILLDLDRYAATSEMTLSEYEAFLEEDPATGTDGEHGAVEGSSQVATRREDYGTKKSTEILDPDATPTKFQSDNRSPNPVYHSLMGTDEIRLLHLDPYDTISQPLHGSLRPTRLSRRPEYVALSYTWADASGDRALREKIFLGNAWTPFAITSNCAAALRRLRSRGVTRIVWIDAICIDQTNIGERSHQVSIMRDIYSRAESVAIFLGGDTGQDVDTPAGRLLQRLSDERFRAGRAVTKDWGGAFDFRSVHDLFAQPYWSRIWVIQEVLLARKADIILGNSSISLHEFIEHFMKQLPHSVEYLLPLWVYFLGESHRFRDVDAFCNLLNKTSRCKSSDRRDMVFALFGLVQGASLEGLVADYSKTRAEIYTGLAAYFLIRHGQSELFKTAASMATFAAATAELRAERGNTNGYPWHPELPSWVPFAESTDPLEVEDFGEKMPPTFDDWRQLLAAAGKKPGYNEHYRMTGLQPGSHGPLWSLSGHRVFRNHGTLLVRALPIVHISHNNTGWVHGDFSATVTKTISGNICVLRPKRTSIQWDICLHTYHLSTKHDDWVIEVPGCDTFLHLRPSGKVPGTYKIASISSVLLVRNYHVPEDSSSSGQYEPSSEDTLPWTLDAATDYRVWMPLISCRLQDLRFLCHWEQITQENDVVAPRKAETEGSLASLTTEVLEAYGRWLEVSPTLSSGDSRHDEFDSVVRTVSLYLERWDDLHLWSKIDEIVVKVPWQAKIQQLASVRADALQHLATRGQSEADLSRNWDAIRLEHRLAELFDDLAGRLTGSPPQATEGVKSLQSFMSTGTCLSFRKSLENIPDSWTWDEIRTKEAEIFKDWTEVKSCWEFMEQSKADCYVLRGKFVQLRALKRLCRREHRDFLIC